MRISLTRIEPDDGAGIAGAMVIEHFKFDDDGDLITMDFGSTEPRVGWQMLLTSFTHWYRTSPITEILTERETDAYKEVVFKTQNSTYSWKDYQ